MNRIVWIGSLLLGLGALSGGCKKDPTSTPEPQGEGLPGPCSGTDWIGLVPQGQTCPVVDNPFWKGGPLFPNVDNEGVKTPLDRYCHYERKDASGPSTLKEQEQLPKLGEVAAKDWLQCDTEVVAPMSPASDVAAAMSDDLTAAFSATLDVPPAPLLGGNGRVRVAVVDTWPDESNVGISAHGYGMASIINDLTCKELGGPAACPIEIRAYLGLNVVERGHRDNTTGGYYGVRTKIARSIYDAVNDWTSVSDTTRLVINISAGWDEAYSADPQLSSDAVHDAIDFATCKGALVIAAAGNNAGGQNSASPPSVDAMFPAAWEGTKPTSCSGPSDITLLYAAGAVDNLDSEPAFVREKGTPPHVAPSFAVPATGFLPGTPAGPFSGTSVSAAVTSAVAAMVWHFDDTLDADGVMGILRSTGVKVGLTRDFGLVPPAGLGVRRLSYCQAIAAVEPGMNCNTPKEGQGTPTTWDVAELEASLATPSATFDGASYTAKDSSSTVCATPIFVDSTGTGRFTGPSACPFQEYPNSAFFPWVTPQPGISSCPACSLSVQDPTTGILEMAIYDELDTPDGLAHAEILTLWSGRTVVARYDLASMEDTSGTRLGDGLKPGEVYKVELPGIDGTTFETATIEWVPDREVQSTTDLVVIR